MTFELIAQARTLQGTGASRRLRRAGTVPGIVYGGEAAPIQVELDHNDLWHALKKEAFHASILDMELNGKTSKVLLRNVQMHPFRQLVLHLDFQRVEAGTKLKGAGASVALVLTGQDTNEEYDSVLTTFTKEIGTKKIYHCWSHQKQAGEFDGILLRGDKNPNTKGLQSALEKYGINTQ